MEKFFQLTKNGTNVKTEAISGLTTFLAMVYIVPVNALMMSKTGMPLDALITATALISIIATCFNGLWANTPVAMSVGMGMNAYFTFGLVLGMGIPWQSALGIVFLSGALFSVLSFTNFRAWIVASVPRGLRSAISAGLGAFLAFIGLKEIGIVVDHPATLVTIGDFHDFDVLLGVFGLVLLFGLSVLRVRGSFIIAIALTSAAAWIFGISPLPAEVFSKPASIEPIFMQLDIVSVLSLSFLPAIIAVLVVDLFDSLGALTGIGQRAEMFKDDNSKKLQKTLESDAFSSVIASFLGLTTTASFLESATGVEEGGRTGLSAVFTALCFVATLFMLPLFKSIPPNAIFPVLVMVGMLMFSELSRIDFSDFAVSVSTFFTVLLMPLTYSVTNGLAFGIISYVVLKVFKKEQKDLNSGVLFLALVSLIVFIV